MTENFEYVFIGIFVLIFSGVFATAVLIIVKIFKYFRQSERKISSLVGLVIALVYVLVMLAVFVHGFIERDRPPKQASAKTNLGAIFTAQVSYFGEHNTYAGGPNAFSLLKWKPEGKSKYAFSCGSDFIPNQKGDPIPRSAMPAQVGASATDFTCEAVGNVDNDPELDIWTVDDAKQLINVVNDI